MLELKNINVSFRSERQDKIFGHTRQQVLFDVSLAVKEGTCLGILGVHLYFNLHRLCSHKSSWGFQFLQKKGPCCQRG